MAKNSEASLLWEQSDWSSGIGPSTVNQYAAGENVVFSSSHLSLSGTEHWFDTAWHYRKKVTFSNEHGDVMTSFPVFISLTSTNFDFSKIQDDCRDLRVADDNGTTLIPFDIELCNVSGNRITLWAKVPQIDLSNTDGVYLYFGNSSASDGQNKVAVWDGYSRVLKFENRSFSDDSHSGVSGTLINGSEPILLTPSSAGQGISLDGVNDYIALDDLFPRTGLTDRSLKYDGGELTIQTTVFIGREENTGGVLVSKPYNGAGQYNYALSYLPTGQIYFLISGGTDQTRLVSSPSETTAAITTRALPREQSAVIVGVVGRDNMMRIYVNGEEWASQRVTITHWPPEFLPGWSGDLNLPLVLGSLFPYGTTWTAGNTGYSFQGILDDFSIIHRERSAAWVEASARQVLDPNHWASFGSMETPYTSHGMLTSSIFCTEVEGTLWESANIVTSNPRSIQMKVRTGDGTMSSADDFSTCPAVTFGESLDSDRCVQSGDRCVQYQLIIDATTAVPEISSVSVTYQPPDPPEDPPPPPPPPPPVVERVIERIVTVPGAPVTPGTCMILESEGSTRLIQREGAEDSYTITLGQAPTSSVTLSLIPDAFLIISPLSLTFTPENWNQPQSVTVRSVGKNILELRADAMSHVQTMATSDDLHYHNVTLPSVTVLVQPDPTSDVSEEIGGSSGSSGSSGSGGETGTIGGNADPVHESSSTAGCSLLK
ncbi:MAG: DUF2341 domain-containing protein [Deltaproteobacteria bacterium]|nr:MAG: DUF2341 domain-containing protein [Deltaproteobacteria bacterium]